MFEGAEHPNLNLNFRFCDLELRSGYSFREFKLSRSESYPLLLEPEVRAEPPFGGLPELRSGNFASQKWLPSEVKSYGRVSALSLCAPLLRKSEGSKLSL